MSLKLKAGAWDDGYAIVEDRGRLFVVRPPFRDRDKHVVVATDLATAVQKYGFEPTELDFANWGDLIGHIRERLMVSRRRDGAPDSARIRKLAERAPARIVRKYLQKVESEMLPRGELRAARGLLAHLLRNPFVKSDPAVLENVSTLLLRAQAEWWPNEAAFRADVPNDHLENEFPSLSAKDFELAAAIQRDGRILVMAPSAA